MTTVALTASPRSDFGKGAARRTRREGSTPAVIYGGNQAPEAIAVDLIRTRTLIYAGGFKTTLFDITVGGKKTRAIPRDYQLDPVSGVPLLVSRSSSVSPGSIVPAAAVHAPPLTRYSPPVIEMAVPASIPVIVSESLT